MSDPIFRALFVDALILIFRYILQALNVPVDDGFLFALATAITGWILGNPAGARTAQAIQSRNVK